MFDYSLIDKYPNCTTAGRLSTWAPFAGGGKWWLSARAERKRAAALEVLPSLLPGLSIERVPPSCM